ncbi:D-alanyl-D-alanine carboxypeptidase family protein [Peribacillus acanthi]|uniref:D-alanyl-D-alanine carboxypeptidase family protein n=1 Tax=Peribacillus acanthi TaxID=2171554 RepID=UPI000D3EBD37|nr:D-alanyl-D-alanine carboxypeptidase family protein [Peribacillus acanthi]
MRILNKGILFALIAALLFSLLPNTARAESFGVSAKSAVLMEQLSGRVIYEKNAHEKRKIASITKIMTAILAIESGKMNETVKISDTAIGTEGSTLYLQYGEKMKLKDLVYGLMLRSGNDAAVAIAEYIGGSMEGFVYLMNQKASEIGMKNSHFSNPHGLDNTPNHFSSAYDMALLTRYAMKNATYCEISSTKVHQAPNPHEKWDYTWHNKNKMLKLYKYSTGGKTGYTKQAKRTLVSTATKDDMHLIAVTLDDPNDWDDHRNMFESAFNQFDVVEILNEDTIEEINVKQYKNKVVIKNSFQYPLNFEEKKQIKLEYKLIKPSKEWVEDTDFPEKVGKAVVYLNGEAIGSRNIFYEPDAQTWKSTFFKSWTSLFFMTVGLKNNG